MANEGIYDRIGVPPVINAAGKLTALGGTAQSAAVAAAQAEAAQTHVDLAGLRSRAGELIAGYCGAEAASVTTGAASGVVIAVAACIAGDDPAAVAALPDPRGRPDGVVIQAGHWVNFGAPVEQMVRLGGGRPLMAGTVNRVTADEVANALGGPNVAALLYVQSHHAVQERMVSLAQCIELSRSAAVPVIVDAAAEEDLRRYIDLGADLVTYSGGKAFGGPTVGFIAGRADLVAACEAQARGIARPMKVGKEQLAGLLVALGEYLQRDESEEAARRARVNRIVCDALDGIAALDLSTRVDEAGRPIERIALRARDDAFDVRDLVRHLGEGSPSIRTRNHHLDDGVVLIDPREVSEDQAALIGERIRAFFV
jgi:D-glucosaminate-6-phosphate ammonia-lyase